MIEIPLAILSFILFKITKFIIGNLYTIYLILNKEKSSQWRILSAETIKTPLSLPVLMTKAPRWNTHAIIGTLGPIEVKEAIALNLDTIKQSTQAWIGCIYSFPDYDTVASFETNSSAEGKWQNIGLKPGKYTVGLRYYHWFDRVKFPVVRIDGLERVLEQDISSNVNNFYHDLIQSKNWFYLSLHYYIFVLLKYKDKLPEAFVRYEFLPVGATDTDFFYGALNPSQALEVIIEPEVLDRYNLYLTVYDYASFPVSWCQVSSPKYVADVWQNKAYYLIRLRSKFKQGFRVEVDEFRGEQQVKLDFKLRGYEYV